MDGRDRRIVPRCAQRLIDRMRADETNASPVETLARARRTISHWSRAEHSGVGQVVVDPGIDGPLGGSLSAVGA